MALARLALRIAIFCEFMGPLSVMMIGLRHVKGIIWVILAMAGLIALFSSAIPYTLKSFALHEPPGGTIRDPDQT